jgi:hypothetical protein
MPTSNDRAPLPRRRLFPLTIFLAAAVVFLAFAGTAAAETKIGEGTSPEEQALPGEVDLLKANVSYNSGTGGLVLSMTSRAASESMAAPGRPPVQYIGGVFNPSFPCSIGGFEAALKQAEAEGSTLAQPYPTYRVFAMNGPISEIPPGLPVASAYSAFETGPPVGFPDNIATASKEISGNTITITATSAVATNQPFNCAEVGTGSFAGESFASDLLFIPLTTKPEPPPVVAQTPAPPVAAPIAQPAPAPAALSIAKAKKPLKLKVGKWTTVKVKLTNTGGSATASGSLRVKAPAGVLVKPERQKLPVLRAGESWTLSVRLQLTAKAKAKAKKSSTLSLAGAAGTVSAKSSLVLKLAGG